MTDDELYVRATVDCAQTKRPPRTPGRWSNWRRRPWKGSRRRTVRSRG
jgi:hypothetical protein